MPGIVVGSAAFTVASGTTPISVATRSGVHKQGAPTVDTTGWTGHHVMEVTADSASDLVLPYGFWHWMNNPLAAGTLLLDATLVMPGGEIVPVTFNGGQSTLTVVNDGVTLQRFDSDVINRTVTRGQAVAVRTWARSASGSAEIGVSWYSDTGTASWYQTGNHINDVSDPPVIGGSPEYNNTYYAHPLGLFARTVTGRTPSFFTWGDSNMANSDQYSYHERALAKRFPYFRCCSAGQGLASGASANVLALARGYSHAIIAMGTNNLGSDITANLPMLTTAIANFRAAGIANILICTLPPSTISSDGWTTVVNQTPFDGSPTQLQNYIDFNAATRAMASSPGGSNANEVYDATSYVEVNSAGVFTQNGAHWKVVGGVTYGTGPHYEDSGHAAAAVGEAAALTRVLAGETAFVQTNPAMGT